MKNKQGCQCTACQELYCDGFSSGHLSDCSLHNEPAYPKGQCDCIFKNLQRNITCPLCGETGMDAAGFKIHITSGYCEVFEQIDQCRCCSGCQFYPQDPEEHPCHECYPIKICGKRETMSQYKSKFKEGLSHD